MKKICRLHMKGSLTVEAAFVVPAVLFVYVFILYMSFYMHDRAAAQSYAQGLADILVKGCIKNIDSQEKQVNYDREWENILTEQWDDSLESQRAAVTSLGSRDIQNRMLFSRIESLEAGCSYNSLTHTMSCRMSVRGEMRLPLKIFNINRAGFETETEIKITDAVKYLRQKRAAQQILS